MDKIVKEIPKKGPAFRLFTNESLAKIKAHRAEVKNERAKEKEEQANLLKGKPELPKNSKAARAAAEKKVKQRPNPGLLAGKQFPEKLGEVPPEFYGKPIEDLDDFYKDKYTFMVVAKDGTMFRFSATKAFFLLSPTLPLRRLAIYILTHPFFSLFITLVILVNCVFMAINYEIEKAEPVFTGIYTAESITRMLARGFILSDFTYLRDPWNWLDFCVVAIAYIQLAFAGGSLASLRTFRVLRALKTIAVVPGLKIIVGALMEAVRRLRDVIILTLFMLSIFALIGLQLYSGTLLFECKHNRTVNYWLTNKTGTSLEICDGDEKPSGLRCPDHYICVAASQNPNFGYTNFDNFLWALLSAFRLMTQDYWENLYQMVLKANGPVHMLFFIFVIFLGSFYLVNLILAIVAMSYDDCQKREIKEAEEELAAALEEQERQIAMLEEMMNRSPSLLSEISHIAPPDPENLTPKFGRGLEPRHSFSTNQEGRTGSISQPGSPFHSRRFNSQGSGTMRHHGPTSPSGGSIKSPPAVLSPDGTGNRPTAEELYHMLHARPRSSRRHQVGSIRSTTGNCMLAVNRRTTLRRSLSPMPRSAAQSGPHPRSGSSSSPSPPPPLTISLPQADCSIASPMKSPPAQLSAKSTSPKHGLGSFRRSEKSRFSWNFPDWRHTSGSKPLPELIVDEEKGGNQNISTPSDIHVPRGELFPYNRSVSRAPSITCVDTQGIQVLRDSIYRASDGQICFEEPELTMWEWVMSKAYNLIYGWECSPGWMRFAGILELFILDPFVDLFITLCIITNTIFMAMDHAGIQPELSNILNIGNTVFTVIFAAEALLKVLALGLIRYLQDRWNVFDISIVILSLVELMLKDVKGGLSILRSFRLLRVFKLAKSWPTLNLLIGIIGRTINALGNLCFVLGIIVFIFAVMGMQVFGKHYTIESFPEGVPRWHFVDFLHSFMIVFRVLCGEWIESTWDCLRCFGYWCIPFFLLTMIIGNLVVLNLFLALLLASFGAESLVQGQEVSSEPNKLQEAIDRMSRVSLFIRSHLRVCCRSLCGNGKDKDKSLVSIDDAVVTVGASLGMSVAVPSSIDVFPDPLKWAVKRQYDESQFRLVVPDIKRSDQEKLNLISKSASDEVVLLPEKSNHHWKENESKGTSNRKFLSSWSSATSISSTSSTSTSDEESTNNGKYGMDEASSLDLCLYPTKAADVREVKVIYFRFPEDCCPKGWRWKYACWDAFLRTKVGQKWWAFRCYTNNLVDHKLFESFIIIMILGSSISLALEDINIDQKKDLREFLSCLDRIFTVTFLMELLLKLSAYGFRRYFSEAWCWLDFIIVVISIVSLAADDLGWGNMAAFRALRTLRALRPLKAVSRWEGMRVVVNALFQAIPAIFNVLLVCLVFWLIFGIMGVTLFGGRFNYCANNGTQVSHMEVNNRSVCASLNYTWTNTKINFDNVLSSYLALFQVATFKGWIEIMKAATDIREKDDQPRPEESRYMYLYFVFFIIFGSFFTLNLFIGVIIDNFNMQKRKAGGSLDIFLTEDQKRYYNAMKKLGSKQPQRPIPKPRLKFQLFFFKLVSGQMFEIAIMSVIVMNMVCLSIEHHNQPQELSDTLEYINAMFVAVFTLECVIKLVGLRWYYFKQPWNVFDLVVVILSIAALALKTLVYVSPTLLRVIRVFRVGRILRLVKAARGIRTLLFSLAVSLPALFNIGLLLFLIMFIYSIFGMSFFMRVKHTAGIDKMFNFETFDRSMLLLFQTSTSAGWHGVLDALLNEEPNCSNRTESSSQAASGQAHCSNSMVSVAYLLTYLVISFLVIINMYIAVILENFSQATEDVQQGLTQDDIDIYYETWEKYDENATEYIHLNKLSEFVNSLEEPLRLPSPNYFKLIHLDIPIYEGDLVHCVDILDALTKNYLGTSKDAAKELGDMKKGSGKKRYQLATSTLMRQREQLCAKLIQVAWRSHVDKKRAEREAIMEHGAVRLEQRRNDILEKIPEDSMSSSADDEEKEIFC